MQKLPWKEVKSKDGILTRSSCWLTSSGCSCNYTYGKGRAMQTWEQSDYPVWLADLTLQLANKLGISHQDLNSCNANRYEKDEEGLFWHEDDEPMFRQSDSNRSTFILSMSFGAPRDFGIRRKLAGNLSAQTVKLCDGDLFVMYGLFQDYYQHTVHKSKGSTSDSGSRVRYNLTWRTLKRHHQHCEYAS